MYDPRHREDRVVLEASSQLDALLGRPPRHLCIACDRALGIGEERPDERLWIPRQTRGLDGALLALGGLGQTPKQHGAHRMDAEQHRRERPLAAHARNRDAALTVEAGVPVALKAVLRPCQVAGSVQTRRKLRVREGVDDPCR